MRKLWVKQNGAAVQCKNFALGAKISHLVLSHSSAKLRISAFSDLVSCIISFKNLTKTVKINTIKIKKNAEK